MYLCIDTVTAESGIALVHEGRAIGFEPLESRHSSDGLFMGIDRLFKNGKLKTSDLKGIVVIKGPGSFTSVRVGVAVANQFSHQLKIPIVGLTTDEWYRFKADQKDFAYLQTMNRDELYAVGLGKLEKLFKTPIIAFSDLPKGKKIIWLGQLNPEHQDSLTEGYELASDLKNTQQTWVTACESVFKSAPRQKAYELVEPYYGKEPKITPSKRHLKMGRLP
jgi:tRNA threonylcarbamoyl adenosine modification protein YeaZ